MLLQNIQRMLPEPANSIVKNFIVKPSVQRAFIDNSNLERIRDFLGRFCSKCVKCNSLKLYLCIDPDCPQRSSICPQCEVYGFNGNHFLHKYIYMVPLFSDQRREGNQYILYSAVDYMKKEIEMALQVKNKEFAKYSKALKHQIDILVHSQLTKKFQTFNFHSFERNFRALSNKASSNLPVSIQPLFYNVRFPDSSQYNQIWQKFALKLIDYCRKLLGEPGTVVPQAAYVYDVIDYLTISLESKLVERTLDSYYEPMFLSARPDMFCDLRLYHTNNFNYAKCYDYFNKNRNNSLQTIWRGINGPRQLILLEQEGQSDFSVNNSNINGGYVTLNKLEIRAGVLGIINCLAAIPQNNNIKKLLLWLNKQQQYLSQLAPLIKNKLLKIEKLEVVIESLSENLDVQGFLAGLINLKIPLQSLSIQVINGCRIPDLQINKILICFLRLPNFHSLRTKGINFIFNKQLQKAALRADSLLSLQIDSCIRRKPEHLQVKNSLKEYQESVLRKRRQILCKLVKMKKVEGNRPKLSYLRNPYFFYQFLASPYI